MIEKPGKAPKNKIAKQWAAFRREYFKTHPPDYRGMWKCAACGKWTAHPELDHIKRRGSHPELRLDETNISILDPDCHRKKDGGMKLK